MNGGSLLLNEQCGCCSVSCQQFVGDAETLTAVLSGISLCVCDALHPLDGRSTKITVSAVNGTYTLNRVGAGQYSVVISGVVSWESFSSTDCSGDAISSGSDDLTISLGCNDDGTFGVNVSTLGEFGFFFTNNSNSPFLTNTITSCAFPLGTAIYGFGGSCTLSR